MKNFQDEDRIISAPLAPDSSFVLNFSFSIRKIVSLLGWVVLVLVSLNLLGQFYRYFFDSNSFRRIILLFFVDKEGNIPSFYSALALLFCSLLLAIIAISKKIEKDYSVIYWRGLSLIFLYLSIDEAASIHELSMYPFRNALGAKGFLYFTWIIPFGVLVLIFIGLYSKFVFSLPKKIKILFVTAASIFLFGSLGMEAIGGFQADEVGMGNFLYSMIVTLEESLEMIGILVFIYALMQYIKHHTNIESIKVVLKN
jgi:hypothetical protein